MKHKIFLGLILALVSVCLPLLTVRDARAGEKALWPKEGENVRCAGNLKLDISHVSDGYCMAAVSVPTKKKLKLQVQLGDIKLNYDLTGDGTYTVIPFQLGSGAYSISLFENVKKKSYASAGSTSVQVKLEREDIAFLYPNQYVNYSQATKAVSKAEELCSAASSDEEIFTTISEYMKTHFMYDYVKAVTITAGQLPDIEGSFAKKMGVCQDLSAIMVCMLRTQGVPSRLIIGYADKNYHAWTITEVDGKQIMFDPTAALSAISPPKTYSMERYY